MTEPSEVDTPQERPAANWRLDLSRRIGFTDIVILALTLASSVALRFGFDSHAVSRGPFGISYPVFAAFIGLAWLACLSIFRTRDPHILGDGILEYRRVIRATFLMFGGLAIASVLFKWDMSRGFLAITFPLGLVSLLVARTMWRGWLRRQRRQGNLVSRVLVIGGVRAAQRLAAGFNALPGAGVVVTGVWIPDQKEGDAASVIVGERDIPLVGSERDIGEAIDIAEADTVIVTDSEHLGPDGMRELTWSLEGSGVELLVSPNLIDISAPRMQLNRIAGEPFLHLQQPQYAEAGGALKGFFDATVGTVLLILVSPILLAAIVAIKVTSPGPAFFLQTRPGRQGIPFKIIKLRTMRKDAAAQQAELLEGKGDDALRFKIENDPRITPVGRFLRRFSIDELPQLINVIKGDMSLVGPRPPLQEELELYDQRVERRLTVRPGMTGLWQVSGRSDLDWEQSVRLDLYYVENWSMTDDLLILARTLKAVLGSDGAY